MDLTLDQAAALLGKTARQVHYLIRQGCLPARKQGKRWLIDDGDLPRSPGQEAARSRRELALDAAVDDALATAPHLRRRFSICDLRAFKIGQPLHADARERLGADHPACRALRSTLEHLGRGCHRFAHADKAAAYRDARESASLAAVELALTSGDDARRLLGAVEQALMPGAPPPGEAPNPRPPVPVGSADRPGGRPSPLAASCAEGRPCARSPPAPSRGSPRRRRSGGPGSPTVEASGGAARSRSSTSTPIATSSPSIGRSSPAPTVRVAIASRSSAIPRSG